MDTSSIPPTENSFVPKLEDSNWGLYRRLLVYIQPLKFYFILSIIGNAIYAGASAFMAQTLEFVIEAVENPTDENRLLLPALIIVLFSLRGLGGFLGGYYIAYVGRHIVHQIRTQVFDRYLRLPSHFFDSSSTGHLISRITYNVEQVSSATTDAITVIVREGLTVIGLLAVMVFANWKLTIMFLAVGPLIGLLVAFVSKRFRKLGQRIMNTVGTVTHVTSEVLNGYRVVRIFGGEGYESKRFEEASLDNLTQSLKMHFTKAISTPIVQSLVAVAIAMLIWIAFAPEIRGDMTAGSFVVIIAAAATMAKPIRQLTQVNEKIQRGVAAARDLFQIIDAPAEIDEGTKTVQRVKGQLILKNVSFKYNNANNSVLKNINLTVNAGETVAFVGRSGSGKSTLLDILCCMLAVKNGGVYLDEIKIEEKKDGLILNNSNSLTSANLNSENDHRLFMAFCIAGMYVGNCTISDPESVDISYPDFISEMKRIGCKIFLD